MQTYQAVFPRLTIWLRVLGVGLAVFIMTYVVCGGEPSPTRWSPVRAASAPKIASLRTLNGRLSRRVAAPATLTATKVASSDLEGNAEAYNHIHQPNPHRQAVLLVNTSLQAVDVVVISPSVATWQDRRHRLRAQFPHNMQLAPEKATAILKFAIGNISSSDIASQVDIEQGAHADLLMFDKCLDADDALNWHPNWSLGAGQSSTTCKVMQSVAWAVHTYTFQYFFRLGDDSYLRIDKFLSMLVQKQLPSGKAIIGQVLQADILGMMQEYAQGMGYAITYEVCEYITATLPWLLDTAPEDGVVARWMFAIGAKFVNSTAWHSANDDGIPCHDELVLAHKLPPEWWLNLTSSGLPAC